MLCRNGYGKYQNNYTLWWWTSAVGFLTFLSLFVNGILLIVVFRKTAFDMILEFKAFITKGNDKNIENQGMMGSIIGSKLIAGHYKGCHKKYEKSINIIIKI